MSAPIGTEQTRGRRGATTLPQLVSEAWELVLDYLKQETVVPSKQLARFVGFGLAGSMALAIGLVLLALGALRALQSETGGHFTRHLSWVPYACTLGGATVLGAVAVWAATRSKRGARP